MATGSPGRDGAKDQVAPPALRRQFDTPRVFWLAGSTRGARERTYAGT